MAKDGTQRGGARLGSGRKKTPLADRIVEGKETEILSTPNELNNAEMPPPKEYLLASQKDGCKLYAEIIYKETWNWLKAHGCNGLVTQQLLESYSQISARYIYCEEKLSQYGMLAKHPTTGEPIASPFVKMSLDYMKQSNQIWYQIFQIVKENCVTGYKGSNPQNDLMETLLRRVK